MKEKSQIDSLKSGLPRLVLDLAFVIMILAALCSYHSVNEWMLAKVNILYAVLTTLGMVVIYYACMRGMKKLSHPLTWLWWVVIGMNLVGFVLSCCGDALHDVNAATATLLPLVYLPLGILLLVWYRGRLASVGHWMIIRILVVNLVPVFFYLAGLLETTWGVIVMEVITIGVDLWYAWVLRRVLV